MGGITDTIQIAPLCSFFRLSSSFSSSTAAAATPKFGRKDRYFR